MKIKELIRALEMFAPLPLQESYDNAGLQVGLTEGDASGALLCLDVTEKVVEEAVKRGCNVIVSHHPLLFRGLKQVSDANYVQRTVWKAVRYGVAIVSMHTNLDNALGGVNHEMARRLGLQHVEFLAEERVVGDPLGGATPEGQLHGGSGVIGTLPEPMAAEDFIRLVKSTFGVACCQTNELLERKVQRVALCGGAGAFLAGKAVAKGADAFVTGEMSYHEFFGLEQQIQLLVIGHYESEQYTTQVLHQIISEACPQLPIYEYGSTNAIRYW